MVVSGKITNLSASDPQQESTTTGVTIGYDTPWRQVQAMLEHRGPRPGVDHQVAPVVRKLGLLDWYTSYELQVRLLPETTLPEAQRAAQQHYRCI